MNAQLGLEKCAPFISSHLQKKSQPPVSVAAGRPRAAVTIYRQCGSGGRTIAQELANYLQAAAPPIGVRLEQILQQFAFRLVTDAHQQDLLEVD